MEEFVFADSKEDTGKLSAMDDLPVTILDQLVVTRVIPIKTILMAWLKIIRYSAYIFEGRLLVIIAENNVKIIIVCTMVIIWIRLLPSKKFGQ